MSPVTSRRRLGNQLRTVRARRLKAMAPVRAAAPRRARFVLRWREDAP